MRRLVNYFFQGLIFVAPLAVTLYVCWVVFTRIDRWLGFAVPGVGFVVTLALVTVIGFLASNLLARSAVGLIDRVLGKLPFVRLLYSSTKDLLSAFVGEKRRFDTPVVVTLVPGSPAKALGFVTRDSLAPLGLADHVAVYFPQSYNFAGNVLLYPAEQVRRLPAESSDVMAFIISGGVAGVK
jgi:uncharacterized membrane protein